MGGRTPPAVPRRACGSPAGGWWSSAAGTWPSAGCPRCSPRRRWSRGVAGGDAGARGHGDAGRYAGSGAGSRTRDLDDAWYVVAATDDPRSTRGCARPPRSAGSSASAATTPAASAWTPPSGRHGTRHRGGARQPGAAPFGRAARRHPRGAARRAPRGAGTTATTRPAWCWSAVARATRSWSRSPAARRSRRPTSWSPTGWRRASCSTSCRRTSSWSTWPSCRAAGRRRRRRSTSCIVDAGAGGQAGGAVQGRRQLRLRPRLRGGAGLPRGRGAGHGGPRAAQPDRGPGAGRHPGHPPRRRPRVHRRLRATCRPATPTRSSTGRPSPGCAARCC